MKNSYCKLTIVLILILLTGCVGTFKYAPSPDTPRSEKQYNYSVAVEQFKDQRPTIGGSGKLWLSWIPLMPFGWGFYNRPEKGKVYLSISSFRFNPKDELAKAAEMSLKKSGLFKDIYFINGYTTEKPDFVFSGRIKSTLYKQQIYTYCLSFFGSLFWLIGAPDGWTENQIEIEFTLLSTKTNKIIWEYTANNFMNSLHWFYYQGQDVKYFVPVMQKNMNEAILNLKNAINTNSNLFEE